ncbi:MAG: InlB B-repeat-containing protein [Bacillota bacterium]
MKKYKIILFLLVLVMAITLVSACGTDASSSYTVHFMSDGVEYASITVSAGEAAVLPDNPTKDGYTFGGWYLDSNFESIFDATNVSANIVVYALWTETVDEDIEDEVADYIITFDSNGGSAVDAITIGEGSTITLPTNPTKTDYVFDGAIFLPLLQQLALHQTSQFMQNGWHL